MRDKRLFEISGRYKESIIIIIIIIQYLNLA